MRLPLLLLAALWLALAPRARADDWKDRTHALDHALATRERFATLDALLELLAEDSDRAVERLLAAVPRCADYLGLRAYERLVDRLATLRSEPARRALARGLGSGQPLAVRWLASEVQVRTRGRPALEALLQDHDERLALLGVELAEVMPEAWVDEVLRARRAALGARSRALARWLDAALARRAAPRPPTEAPATEAPAAGTQAREPAHPRTVGATARAMAALASRVAPGELQVIHDVNTGRYLTRLLADHQAAAISRGPAPLAYVDRSNRLLPTKEAPLDPRHLVILEGFTSGDPGFGIEQVRLWRAALLRFVHDGGHLVDHGWFDEGDWFDHSSVTEEGHLQVHAKPRFPVEALFPGGREVVVHRDEVHITLGAPLDPLLDGSPLRHPFMEQGLRWGVASGVIGALTLQPRAPATWLIQVAGEHERQAFVLHTRVGKGAILRITPDGHTSAEVDEQAWLLVLNFMAEWLDRRDGHEPRGQ